MAHQTIKLKPGIETNETPALNEVGISTSNLIRFTYNKDGLGLVQKYGGWSRYFPQQLPTPARALAAWEDLNAQTHLAVGCQNNISGQATLGVVTSGVLANVTPRYASDSIAPAVSTTAGSAIVTLTDNTTEGITNYDTVYILTHISIGGLILFGMYLCITDSLTQYQITSTDQFGNALPALSSSTSPTVASFATSSGSNFITVTLANHGFTVGQTYPVLVATTVGGVTLYGNYIITAVANANTFTIEAQQNAASTATASINGGNLALTYYFGVGAVPQGTGYGQGGYGQGGYGSGAAVIPATGTPMPATDWTLDNFGEVLIACPINGSLYQPVFQYDPTSGQPTATVIPQSPPVNDGIFIAMPQRQIVAWGSTVTGIQDPLLIRWCDVSNYNVWIGSATNQAGQYRLSRGSKIVGGMQGPRSGLIWTDVDLWSMTYIGGELVYSFFEIGTNCGLIGRKAMGALGGVVYWMGASQFYVLSGDGVEILPCDVWDVVFQQVDTSNANLIRCAVNTRFGEVAWFFPTLTSGGEVAFYVKYNTLMKCWDYGALARSAWIDQSVLGPPIGTDPNLLYIYQHETSPDADGQPLRASFTTGWAAISEGDYKTFIDQLWPDAKWGPFAGQQSATLQITFLGCDYPGDTPQVYGPYSVTQSTEYVNPRLRNRLISMQVTSTDSGSFWRLGAMRYRGKPDGRY